MPPAQHEAPALAPAAHEGFRNVPPNRDHEDVPVNRIPTDVDPANVDPANVDPANRVPVDRDPAGDKLGNADPNIDEPANTNQVGDAEAGMGLPAVKIAAYHPSPNLELRSQVFRLPSNVKSYSKPSTTDHKYSLRNKAGGLND